MKRLFLIILILLGCKKASNLQYDYALYAIFYNLNDTFSPNSGRIIAGFYDNKNSQVVQDASIYLNDQKLSYYYPFYKLFYDYFPNQEYKLKVIYKDVNEEITFKTIEIPDTFYIVSPPTRDTIELLTDLKVKWKVDSSYYKTHDYYYIIFFENKSKDPSLVYSAGPFDKNIDSIVIPGYYIDTKNTRYELSVFLVNYIILDKFKPYPGYKFSFIATGEIGFAVYYTRP